MQTKMSLGEAGKLVFRPQRFDKRMAGRVSVGSVIQLAEMTR